MGELLILLAFLLHVAVYAAIKFYRIVSRQQTEICALNEKLRMLSKLHGIKESDIADMYAWRERCWREVADALRSPLTRVHGK